MTSLQRSRPIAVDHVYWAAVTGLSIGGNGRSEETAVRRRKHRLGVAAEVGTGHGHDVRPVAGDELAKVGAEFVVGVDRLPQPLVVELLESDKHERAALAGSGRRLDEQVPFAPPVTGALLHRPHAEFVGPGRTSVAGAGDGNRGEARCYDSTLRGSMVANR